MANYKTPGVYIEEISKLPASVAPVATAIPAFIGYTEKSEKDGQTLAANTPVRITSLLEYEEIFGGAFDESLLVTLTGTDVTEANTIISVTASSAMSAYTMYYNLNMYFANGGGPCYVVSVGAYAALPLSADPTTYIGVSDLQAGLAAVEKEDEVTLLVVPEAIALSAANRKSINDDMLTQCNKLQDRFAMMDASVLGGTVEADGIGFRADVGSDYLKYGASYYPSLKTTINLNFENAGVAISDNRPGGTFDGITLVHVLDGAANGTITIDDFSVLADDVVTINGQALTEGAALEWQAGASNDEAATSLCAAIVALSDEAYTATVNANVIAITAMPGSAGTSVTLAYADSGSGSGISLSGATLLNLSAAIGTITVDDFSVLADDVVTVNGQALTEGAALDWQAGTSNDEAASSLRAAIVALADSAYTASVSSNVITITAVPGSAGNSVTLAYADSGSGSGVSLSGATLSGGADGLAANKTLYNNIVKEIRKQFGIVLYPSSTMAGVYARVDHDRGVWKAPANVSLRQVKDPSVLVTGQQQENLNVDATSGKSINVIRKFAGKGIIVWGARTLAGNDNEWRYVPVRRLFIFVEESVKKATEFVVFEPNDAKTWLRTKTMIENFLAGLWRDGALAGAKPEEAFYVKVGLGETMTALDILEGRMNIEIGMAAVRPAEFIILKFSHKLQES